MSYDDSDGTQQTLAADTAYTVDLASQPGWIVPALNTRWPTAYRGINSVQVEFTAGYAAGDGSPPDHAANVLSRAKLAVKSLVAHWYGQRDPIADKGWHEAPYHLTRLVNGLRVWR